MLGHPLDTRVRRIVAVTVSDGLELTFDEKASDYFSANVSPPNGSNSTFDGSPRTGLSPYTLYWVGAYVILGVSHRVEALDGTVYELIAKPEPVTHGRRVLGHSAPMLAVADLYPRSAEVKELGGEAVLATIECALFSERESKGGRGSYHDTMIEAPASAWAALNGGPNRQLHFGDGSVWHVVEATLAAELPIITATVRKQG